MKTIYYLPGRDNCITDRVGQAIHHLGFDVIGRDLLSDFIHYRINRQVEIIQHDILEYFSGADAAIIACSYGAFLLLQALAELNTFQGRILLFCPVLGPTQVEAGGTIFFRPPRGDKLLALARKGEFPPCQYLEIHTGTMDQQCHYSLAEQFSRLVSNTKLYLIQGAGHHIDQGYIEKALERFLIK